MKKKKILVVTGGGDCPGLNAAIRAIVKSAKKYKDYKVYGSMEAFNGILERPQNVVRLTNRKVRGIHVKGGTILKTTNAANPLRYPTVNEKGETVFEDITPRLAREIVELGFEAVINIGGDGSQKISLALHKQGLNVVGVPKTIDNDLNSTDLTFGFHSAVQEASDALDNLVTTAESHDRVMILEVMGRNAGWIALYTAISGGAEICLIPEVPFDIEYVKKKIDKRYFKGDGFVNIVVAEGAKPKGGAVTGIWKEGAEHIKLGGVGNAIRVALEDIGCEAQVRVTKLGHIQRGGTPVATDRILATAFGVKAFEMVVNGEYGRMVSYQKHSVTSVPIADAVEKYNHVHSRHYLINTARAIGISFGDE